KLPPLARLDGAARPLAEAPAEDARAALLQRAGELELRAAELKHIAADVRTTAIVEELERLAGPEVAEIDLLRAALTIAKLDEQDLDVDAYVKQVERMADEVKRKF